MYHSQLGYNGLELGLDLMRKITLPLSHPIIR
jgi:hypothetical protein